MMLKAYSRSVFALVGSLLVLGASLSVPAGLGQTKKAPAAPAKKSPGEIAFQKRCASCHGAKGEGGPGFAKPLMGTRSVSELTNFIKKQMPPGPVKTPPADAAIIADFMHGAFYSPLAQERNRPARVELTRLTVRQFRNAVADLVGDFHSVLPARPAQGLTGDYYKSRNTGGGNRALNRIDAEVNFDFKTEAPNKDMDPYNFTVIWTGSVLAPDTGDYEFIIKSDQAVRMWINEQKDPFVDGWVRSANENEFRGSVNLLGGRAYSVRLEFTKATPGVDDTEKKKKSAPAKASVALLWKRPKRVEEVIPSRYLFPDWIRPTFVVTSPFPPDDRSIGYERGNSVSKEWDEATTAAALETAAYISSNIRSLTGIPDDAPDRIARLKAGCKSFVERAFRRPLTKDLEDLYINRQFDQSPNAETALKRVVILTLKSPRFLYREIGAGQKDAYATAAHLSFGIWDTLPDPELLQAAAKGELATRDQVTRQADRMASDPRAWNKLREFLLLWLKIDEVPDLVKSVKKFPEFDLATASDLRSSLEIFLESTAWSPTSDYRDLMLSQNQYLNGRLAKLYGVSLAADAPFQAVKLDPEKRSGLLTQPYMLSRLAYIETTSPIHRGVLIIRNMLGRTLNPPPAAFTPLAASLHPSLTTRERVALQTKPAACRNCHEMINPLGFTLEQFDAIGRIRSAENGKPINANGSYVDKSGNTIKFNDARDLARYLATSEDAHEAFVEKLFQHVVKQPARAFGVQTLPKLEKSFAQNEYSIRKLIVESVVSTAFSAPAPAKVAPRP
ncbi:MAG: DUF1592 domain-containing protein [Fimbriimonas sp.]